MIIWVVVGLIGGWIIAMLVKHTSRNLIDIIFGIVGSLVGSFIANSALGIPTTSVYTFIIAAANPASKYECYEFDAALTNKFANIKFRPEVSETLDYLESKHGTNLFLTWLNTDKGLVELGEDDFEISDLRMTPRIIDNAITLCKELEDEAPAFQRKALETIPDLVETMDACTRDLGSEGRLIVRYSGTEPKARLLLEGRDIPTLEKWSHRIAESIKRQVGG